jgi:tetratricopeptide (TPR) repeat protein
VHLRAARWLEEHREDAPTHVPISDEALAHHYATGGDNARALEHIDRAAVTAFRSGAHRAATELLGRALELAELAGDVPTERRAVWLRKRGEARFALGDVDHCIADSRAALALLGHTIPRTTLGWVASVVGGLVVVLLGKRSERSEPSIPDRAAALCAGQLADSFYFTLSFLPMLAVLLWGLTWARRANELALVIEAEARLAYVVGVAGFQKLAKSIFAHAKGLEVDRAEPAARARADVLDALFLLGLTEHDRARALAESAGATLLSTGDVQDSEVARTVAGYTYLYRDDAAKAAAIWGSVLESARDRTNTQHYAWGLFLTARTTLAAGRALEAVAPLEEARKLMRAGADRSSLVIAQSLLALAYVRAGALDRAADALAEATPTLSRGVIPLTPCFEAYASAADVAVALWNADRKNRAREGEARSAVRALARFARLFPLARPTLERLRAELDATTARRHATTERPPALKRPRANDE